MNRKYKDTVFTVLFNDEEKLRQLFNAIESGNYTADAPIVINTLSSALFMGRKKDVSFTIGDTLVVLIEHQSTLNPNMPLRLLLYIARIYEKIIEK